MVSPSAVYGLILTHNQYGDIARMLNMYQLWLDDLYPRAKFADALAIIEKVGHTKRMQVDRRAWIDEGKPKHNTAQDDDHDLDVIVLDDEPVAGQEDALEGRQPGSETQQQPDGHSDPAAEAPDEDELDALLADSALPAVSAPNALPPRSATTHDDPFADEMEAMEGMEDMW